MLMSAEESRKERIEEIFLEARELDSGEREYVLEKACQGDPELREAVDKLLHADERPDSLLDGTVDLFDARRRGRDEFEGLEGQVIGPYKLLQQIGEGGFGVVYMADQAAPVRRKVAVKLIKPGMDSKEVVARFEAERQALAMMEHPNIAKVLDTGTTDSGRPYFAMELVKGVPITEYCDRNALDTHQRLELFNYVCRAVQHAHQKGIIHRDIKPTNVLVTLHDSNPIPKVIDFGVAKALSHHLTEKTLFTRYGQVMGTPQYMSPEQAEMSGLDVDTRSDIYSLGVLLYELLTGKTPLDAETLRTAGFDAMRRLICDSEFAKPSSRLRTLDAQTATGVASVRSTVPHALTKLVAGDLDWIVMKCLDKDRNRRYESANGLVNDIEHYLRDEPVEAGPPTFAYQLSKLYRRNRMAVASLAAIGAALLVGITLTTIAWASENKQRQIAVEQRQIAEEKADEARQQAANAKSEAKRAQSTLDVLKSLLTQASPDPEKGTEVKVSDFLGSFANDLNRVKLDDPRVEIAVRLTLAEALARFSMSAEVKQQIETAERIARKTFPSKSDELSRFLLIRGAALYEMEAVEYLEEALACLDNGDHSKALEVDVRTTLGMKLGWDRPKPARSQFEQACKMAGQLDDTELVQLTTNPYRAFADWLLHFHIEMDTGRKLANEAIALAKKSGNPREEVESLLLMRQFEQGETREAYLREAKNVAKAAKNGAAMSRALSASCDDLKDGGYTRPDLCDVASQLKDELVSNWHHLYRERPPLGAVLALSLLSGNSDDASELETLSTLLSPSEQRSTAGATAQWLRLGGMLRMANEWEKRETQDYVYTPVSQARCYSAARDFSNAVPLMEKAIKLTTSLSLTDKYWLTCELAFFLEAAGQPEKAQAIFKELASEILNESNQLHDLFSSVQLICIARAGSWEKVSADDIQKMEAKIKAILTELESSLRAGKYGLSLMLNTAALGLLEEHRGNREKQIEYFLAANRFRPGTFEQMNGEWISDTVVKLLMERGETDRLEKVLRDDVRHRDESLLKIHPERAFTRIRLAQMLVTTDRKLDDAKQLLAEAAEVYAYHGEWIPRAEHETLEELQRTVAEKIDQQQ